jgi:hypothetical protein
MLGNDRVRLHPFLDGRYPERFAARLENMAAEIETFNDYPLLAPARERIAVEAEWKRSAFSGASPSWARIFAGVKRPAGFDELPARLRSYAEGVRFADQRRKRMYPKRGFRLKHEAIVHLLRMVKCWTGKNCFPEVADLLAFLHEKVGLSEPRHMYSAKKLQRIWDRSKRNLASALRVSSPNLGV